MSRRISVVVAITTAVIALLAVPAGPALHGAVPSIDGGALANEPAVRVAPDPRALPTGFDSLFIGHSFFIPIAGQMPFHTSNAGLTDHTQSVVFAGGASGAPLALWNAPSRRAAIQEVLDGGDVELLGMTYHFDYPTLEGYRNWVDYAVAQNPDTTFFVGLPWIPSPGTYDAAEYRSIWLTAYDEIAKPIIDELRIEYPSSEFFAIPYGQAAAELYVLFDADELPDVDLLSGSGEAIFSDGFGHADQILRDLAALVWLRAIYGVDLSAYDYDPGYETDLAAIADAIMDTHDPAYNAPWLTP